MGLHPRVFGQGSPQFIEAEVVLDTAVHFGAQVAHLANPLRLI